MLPSALVATAATQHATSPQPGRSSYLSGFASTLNDVLGAVLSSANQATQGAINFTESLSKTIVPIAEDVGKVGKAITGVGTVIENLSGESAVRETGMALQAAPSLTRKASEDVLEELSGIQKDVQGLTKPRQGTRRKKRKKKTASSSQDQQPTSGRNMGRTRWPSPRKRKKARRRR